jgi:hypothetical protein
LAATTAVLSIASLVPLLKGDSTEARSGAVMSADAELWNGRFALLGLVALASLSTSPAPRSSTSRLIDLFID